MSDFSPEQSQVPPQIPERPMTVTVFGILNIAFGCYFLVRMIYDWSKFTKAPEKITGIGILESLIVATSFGLVIWLIVLGYGLLTMKRWARRGSVLYGWIQVVLMVITLGALFIGLSRMTMPERWWLTFLTINNALALIHWIYMILLLIFMQSAKVKRAFS